MDASVLSDDDYDVISNPGLDSSITDLNLISRPPVEPPASQAARVRWKAGVEDAEEIQRWTRAMLDAMSGGKTSARRRQSFFEQRTTRVYVDGVFDVFSVGDALQLRQAKLSFPFVHLIVGVFDDAQCKANGAGAVYPHVERCEVIRHCRWVDEVVADAPWRIDEAFMSRRRIDYVAFDEGATVDPKYDAARVKGYDDMKSLGKVILTRKTTGLTVPPALSSKHARFSSATPTPPTIDDDEPFRQESPSPPVALAARGPFYSNDATPIAREPPRRLPSPVETRPPLPIHRLPSPVDDDGSPPADLFL